MLRVEFVLFSSHPHRNKELKGQDTILKQSGIFIWMPSRVGPGQSQGRQRPPIVRRSLYVTFWLGGTSLIDRSIYIAIPLSAHVLSYNEACFGQFLVLFHGTHVGIRVGPVWPGPNRQRSSHPAKLFIFTWDLGSLGSFFFELHLPFPPAAQVFLST